MYVEIYGIIPEEHNTIFRSDCGFDFWSGQTKDYKTGIYCSFDNYRCIAFRSNSKDWLS